MASTAKLRQADVVVRPTYSAISGPENVGTKTQSQPYYMSQGYNISACDAPDRYVQLPYPNDGNYGWEVIDQTGDLGCVYVWQWSPGEGAPIARAVLTWRHPGQTTITYASTGNGNIGSGGCILKFTINAC